MEGDALLIAGVADEVDDPRLPLITQLGEAVLASGASWRVRRLAAGGPDRDAPSRGNVRRELDAMLDRPATARIIVISATIARTIEGPAVVCGRAESGFREDASVSLAWLAKRIQRASNIPTVFLIAAPETELDLKACLDVLGTSASEHVVAIAAGDPLAILRVVSDGLWREAIDLATGSVTPSSLGSYLARCLPTAAIQPSASIRELLSPRGLVRADLAERTHEGDSDELIGAVLPGQFRVTSELGRGNFAVVYRAHQEMMKREVAIKVLPTRLDAEAMRRFPLEIRAVAGLDHRNVVRVWHADVMRDGRMFVAMELLVGPTLQEVIARGPVEPTLALEMTRQLLAGLAAAHAAGIIHADVKPANVILVDEQRVVLLDFGLSCLRTDNPVAVGGTPAFMAPEQLNSERIGASVDVYATALVALALVAGTQTVEDRARSLATFDTHARAALQRALSEAPEARFASAAEMLAALTGESAKNALPPTRPPFRVAAPFSEQERDDFHGRTHEVERLLEHVLFHRAVVYVAPSGTGKTSLLLAGLVPRLRDLDVDVTYVSCRAGAPTAIASTIADKLKSPSTKRLVVIVDQVETTLVNREDDAVLEGLGMPAWPADAPISVVWAVREEYLARLLDRVRRIEPGVPIVRLAPLAPEVAAEVFRVTLQRRGVTVDPALIDQLIADLASATARLASELGWGDAPAVYPPHLQLAGAILDVARQGGAVDLALYRGLGGFKTILSKHLHQVLEAEFGAAETAIAREVLIVLMSSSRMQTACEERDLIARVGRPPAQLQEVLQFLRNRGLLVTARGPAGEPVWDLAHDSLGAQIEAWLTATDADRRRAMDLVRQHLLRSTIEEPNLLGVSDLREISNQLDARDFATLDTEWEARLGLNAAHRLVRASRRAIRFRRGALAAFGLTAIAIASVFANRWLEGRREITLRDRDIGVTRLVLRAFDWDPSTLSARDAPTAELTWKLMRPANDDQDLPGVPFDDEDLSSEPLEVAGAARADRITARGGAAVLVVDRKDRTGAWCSPVVVPVRSLPGYNSTRDLNLRIPTCEASAVDMLQVGAGPFLAEGLGEPPSKKQLGEGGAAEHLVQLPAFALDRTEVPNAILATLSGALAASDRGLPLYPNTNQLRDAGKPDRPVASLTWHDAALVCRMLGKRLPTSQEWGKALRGPAITENRSPRRNLPWGTELEDTRANVNRGGAVAPMGVGSLTDDKGPYGHLDLAGNVSEWTSTLQPDGLAIIRGGNWDQTTVEDMVEWNAIENPRPPKFTMYVIGFRCAGELTASQLAHRTEAGATALHERK